MVRSTLAQRVIATVAYCDQFNYPLTEAEIQLRLIQKPTPDDRTLHSCLVSLMAKGILHRKGTYYFLSGSEESVAIRQQRAAYSVVKVTQAYEVVAALRWIPWIKGIALTGSLAMNNATQDDDLDFMIITQAQRLWLTRPLVIAYAWLKGKRRSWQREEKNSWCFNLWLEETELHTPGLNSSLYTAYEVCQARFLLNRARVSQRFIWANRWLAEYLPYYFLDRCENASEESQLTQGVIGVVNWIETPFSWLLSLTNVVAYALQWAYMLPHRTREKVTRQVAFFHPRDTQRLVRQRWQATVRKAGV